MDFGDRPESNARVRAAVRYLHNASPEYVEEAIAGVNTLAIVLPEAWRDAEHRRRAEEALAEEIERSFSTEQPAGREVVLPVCYDASMAPDLARVAEHTGLSPKEIVQLHQSVRYECAVYPTATPGGWNLIGRCPLQLFDPQRAEPALISLGDVVQFESISVSSFERLWSQR